MAKLLIVGECVCVCVERGRKTNFVYMAFEQKQLYVGAVFAYV